MLEVEVQVFAIGLEVFFSRPRPFSKDKLDALASWLTDPTEGFALRPEQVRVRHTDIIFDYELKASLFGGNATFTRNAEKAAFLAHGARTRQDADLLHLTATRFVNAMAAPEQLEVTFSANAHVAAASASELEGFLDKLRPNAAVTGPGTLGFVRVEPWMDDIRITIEPSVGVQGNLFLAWSTRMAPSADSFQTLGVLAKALKDAVGVYGLKFRPLT